MNPDEKLAQWAALFVETCRDGEDRKPLAVRELRYSGVSAGASELLQAVDAGGVPAFVTSSLKQLALENGVEVAEHWTPNEIVEALRGRARANPSVDMAIPAIPAGK